MDEAERLSGSIEEWIGMVDSQNEEERNTPCSFYLCGMSMYPLARSRLDRVSMVHAGAKDVKPGDIVTLRMEGAQGAHYVAHRLLKKKQGRILTMGDGNLRPDPWLDGRRIIGRVIHIQRGGVSIYLDQPLWRLYGRCWVLLRPVRAPLLMLLRALRLARNGRTEK